MNSANPPPSSGYSELLERVSSLEQSVQKLLSEKKRSNSQQHLLHLEQQHETCSSPRLRVPYPSTFGVTSASVPSVFQMPLHYPRFSRADYEAMEEWRLARLLEEYERLTNYLLLAFSISKGNLLPTDVDVQGIIGKCRFFPTRLVYVPIAVIAARLWNGNAVNWACAMWKMLQLNCLQKSVSRATHC
ncbi:hypothetical protein GOP47_0029761 [Adiantum capillus-veneris]|nr:hypothetical protein GOP47_0029761 [Adiantum capillus-veneris]